MKFLSSFLPLLLLSSIVLSAPLPTNKPARKPAAVKPSATPWVGTWALTWQGMTGGGSVCTFHEQGGFVCRWYGQDWVGSWTYSDGMLIVTECPNSSAQNGVPNWLTWKVSLGKGGLAGRFADGSVFQLTEITPVPKPDA